MNTILTIAASDPSGGAGIQQDIKTVSALGHYALSVETALTAQSTQGVGGVMAVPVAFFRQSLDILLQDIRPHAVKIGVVPTLEHAEVIADVVRQLGVPTTLDPVLASTSGWPFTTKEAVEYVKRELAPLCTLVTPNLPEAEALQLGEGTVALLVKGGHAEGNMMTDTLIMPDGSRHTFSSPRIATRNLHGTGCTLSSAIATLLAEGLDLPEAVRQAKEFVSRGIERGSHLAIGKGNGPLWLFD